jgi:hypothetical protein
MSAAPVHPACNNPKGTKRRLNAAAAVAQLTVPAMFVVANNDAYTSVEETRAMYQAAKTADKRLEVLPSKFNGMHGWGMLTDVSSGGVSSAATTVVEFVAAHTGSSPPPRLGAFDVGGAASWRHWAATRWAGPVDRAPTAGSAPCRRRERHANRAWQLPGQPAQV